MSNEILYYMDSKAMIIRYVPNNIRAQLCYFYNVANIAWETLYNNQQSMLLILKALFKSINHTQK